VATIWEGLVRTSRQARLLWKHNDLHLKEVVRITVGGEGLGSLELDHGINPGIMLVSFCEVPLQFLYDLMSDQTLLGSYIIRSGNHTAKYSKYVVAASAVSDNPWLWLLTMAS
jgi:hypothetical protein